MRKSLLRIVFLPLVVITTLLFASCQESGEKPEDFVLKIFETTDIHGALLPYNFIKDQESS